MSLKGIYNADNLKEYPHVSVGMLKAGVGGVYLVFVEGSFSEAVIQRQFVGSTSMASTQISAPYSVLIKFV